MRAILRTSTLRLLLLTFACGANLGCSSLATLRASTLAAESTAIFGATALDAYETKAEQSIVERAEAAHDKVGGQKALSDQREHIEPARAALRNIADAIASKSPSKMEAATLAAIAELAKLGLGCGK